MNRQPRNPQPKTPLRQRLIEDMKLRNMAYATQQAYVRAVKNFSKFHGNRSPDRLGYEDVRAYQLHLVSRGLQAQTINQILCALRFFYHVTLGKPDASAQIPLLRRPDKLPLVLSQEEVARFLDAVDDMRYKAAFACVYASGLRVSEVAALKAEHIDSQRMVIHVRDGKGRKDRYVMLSPQLLDLLRAYWRKARPQHWLFPGADPTQHITSRSLERACRKAVQAAGFAKPVTVHTLRHSFATHLLEQGVELRVIQDLLGHRHIATTSHYARVATSLIQKTPSPLDRLVLDRTPAS
jgi:site-specific recombinase XerD